MKRHFDKTRIHLVYSRVRDGDVSADELRQAMHRLTGSERVLLLRMLEAQRRPLAKSKPKLFQVTN
jgi:hypothetical protein